MSILNVEHLSHGFGDRAIFSDVSFRLLKGEHIGLVGANGEGKSTFMSIVTGKLLPDEGKVEWAKNVHAGYLDQHAVLKSGMTIREALKAAFDPLLQKEQRMNEICDMLGTADEEEMNLLMEELGTIQDELTLHDFYTIDAKVEEVARALGLLDLGLDRDVTDLSGGQRTKVLLAKLLLEKPDILLLDEPTAQLDPIGTRRFLDTLGRLNRDLGTAVLLSEQRLEEVLPMADRVLIMHQGQLLGDTVPSHCGDILEKFEKEHGEMLSIAPAMPTAVRVWQACHNEKEQEAPVSIRQGRSWLQQTVHKSGQTERGSGQYFQIDNSRGTPADKAGRQQKPQEREKTLDQEKVVLQAKGIFFEYEKGKRVLEDFSIQVPKGKIFAIMGGNGSGKSTALKVIMGIYKARRGKVRASGRIRYLAQNPRSLFTELTVEEELTVMLSDWHDRSPVEKMLRYLELEKQQEQNPMDLSGGQQQRLALGKLLMTEPDILLLDEPTKGLDGAFKKKLAELLKDLCLKGKSIVLVSHDMDFCAQYANICGLLFDGQIISQSPTESFFRDNVFYTTPAGRMSQGILGECFRTEDIIAALQKAGCG